jgi:hypothetical protein
MLTTWNSILELLPNRGLRKVMALLCYWFSLYFFVSFLCIGEERNITGQPAKVCYKYTWMVVVVLKEQQHKIS